MFPYGIWMGGRQGRQQMELRQLECFAAVVEEGSISAAARKLHMSQPPLSLRMHQLEAECGVTLFVRGARQITLTEAGNLLFRYAREILELETAAGADLESLRRGRRGNIRLGLISSCGCRELYDGIRRFHISHPDISFVIREGNTFDLQEDIRENRIELAVIRTPYRDASLEHITLRTDPMAAAGALPGTDDERPLPLRALTGFPLILYRRWPASPRMSSAPAMMPEPPCSGPPRDLAQPLSPPPFWHCSRIFPQGSSTRRSLSAASIWSGKRMPSSPRAPISSTDPSARDSTKVKVS